MVEPARNEPPSANELLRAALNGDNKAFAAFCQVVLPEVRIHVSALCMSHRLGTELVDDFCNETVSKALDYVKHVPAKTNPIRNAGAWIKAVAHNVVIDFVRKAVRLKEKPIAVPEEEAAVGFLNSAELFELEDLFDILTPREREVTGFIYLHGLTIREVSEKLGISNDAVRKAHQRALRRLRDELR